MKNWSKDSLSHLSTLLVPSKSPISSTLSKNSLSSLRRKLNLKMLHSSLSPGGLKWPQRVKRGPCPLFEGARDLSKQVWNQLKNFLSTNARRAWVAALWSMMTSSSSLSFVKKYFHGEIIVFLSNLLSRLCLPIETHLNKQESEFFWLSRFNQG